MKKLVLIFVACIIGISVTGCVGSSHNLSDDEIIERIQTKMKKEFDKLNFTVDFNQYEFKVNVTQSFGEVGKVTVKDKRYNYDPIVVYDGSFGNTDKNIGLDQEKIGTNPVIFVYHGYLNYLDKTSEKQLGIVESYLNDEKIEWEKVGFRKRDFSGQTFYPTTFEIVNGIVERNRSRTSEIFLWKQNEMTVDEYLNYYRNKNIMNFNYEEYDDFMSKGVLYFYRIQNYKQHLELENNIRVMLQSERIFIQFG